jgi:hypothetical protein
LTADAGSIGTASGTLGKARDTVEGGSRVEAMPAWCTTLRTIHSRILWNNVVGAKREENPTAWSTVLPLSAALQEDGSVGAFWGIMLRSRWWWGLVRPSPLLSFRVRMRGGGMQPSQGRTAGAA